MHACVTHLGLVKLLDCCVCIYFPGIYKFSDYSGEHAEVEYSCILLYKDRFLLTYFT